MNYVDTYYLSKACELCDYRNPADIYYNISEEIIDNRWTEKVHEETRQDNLYNITVS